MKEIAESIITSLRDRTKAVFVGLYSVFWLLINHKFLLILMISNKPIVERYSLAQEQSGSFLEAYVLPLVAVIVYVLLVPWIDYVIFWVRSKPLHLQRVKKYQNEQAIQLERDKAAQLQIRAEEKFIEAYHTAEEATKANKEASISKKKLEVNGIDPILVEHSNFGEQLRSIGLDYDPKRVLLMLASSHTLYDLYQELMKYAEDIMGFEKLDAFQHYLSSNFGVAKHSGNGNFDFIQSINELREKFDVQKFNLDGYVDKKSTSE